MNIAFNSLAGRPSSRPFWLVGRFLLGLAVFAAGARAAHPAELVLHPQSHPLMGVAMSPAGVLEVRIPDRASVFVAPQFADLATGRRTNATTQTKFAEASGEEVSSTAVFAWSEGGRATVDFHAKIEAGGVRLRLSWTTEGPATGHVRLDLLLPHQLAKGVEITDPAASILFSNTGVARGGLKRLPAVVVSSAITRERMFSIEGDGLAFEVAADPARFERNGLEVRIERADRGRREPLQSGAFEYFLRFP